MKRPAELPDAPTGSPRLDHLDAVRAFALLLGVVFHASMSFLPVFIGWAVMDVSASLAIGGPMLVSHSFRMPLFFLIAGYFSHMTCDRKGERAFIGSRLMRIALPFVAGWFVLRPLLVAAWIMGAQSLRGEVQLLVALQAGFEALGSLPQGLLVGTHLWFLYYLLLVTGIVLAVRAATRRIPGVHAALARRMDAVVAWVAESPFASPVLALPTGACVWRMATWGMDTPDRSLVPELPVLLVYGGFFASGWLLQRQRGLIDRFGRVTPGRVVYCVLGTGAALALVRFQADPGNPRIGPIRVAFSLSYGLMMWSLVALTIGLFKRWFNRPSRTVRYLADASYWIYLLHLPVVVWLQVAVAELPLHWLPKLAAISSLTVGISVVLSDLFVRSTWVGAVLNGRRRERVLFRFGRRGVRLSAAPDGGAARTMP